jgi:hypothetical protein
MNATGFEIFIDNNLSEDPIKYNYLNRSDIHKKCIFIKKIQDKEHAMKQTDKLSIGIKS